jgi:putative transposon-encoded protein
MIKYKDEKPKITDKASILVNSYKNTMHNFGNSAKTALG